ncbi:hypothetical protein [Pengzhenrongella sp.]|jgi:hypothetical protein|uniref:hypothetical protein n=1 Tax=Pengzhenrongella sp. TaxID=2888820 RepID=UPI002F92E5B4
MTALWIAWPACAVLILALYAWLGRATNLGPLGLLIDERGRYSLTRIQLSLWTLVVISLIAGIFAARATVRGIDPLAFSIPSEVLGLLGISIGSTAIATGIKVQKNRSRTAFVAASKRGEARVAQALLIEEGPQADKSVDIAKMQNFLFTAFLVVAYVILAVHALAGAGPGTPITGPADVTSLPGFNPTFLTLLGISHAGYLAGKLPTRGELTEDTPAYSLAQRNRQQVLDRATELPMTSQARAAAKRAHHAEQRDQALRNAAEPAPTTADTSSADTSSQGDQAHDGSRRGQRE